MAKQITKLEYKRLIEQKQRLELELEEARVRLNDAKSRGDLSENAEFDTAKSEVLTLNEELNDVNFKLRSEVIDSWIFVLKSVGSDDIPNAEFEIELGNTRTEPFDFNSQENLRGIVTKNSKLGAELSRYLELKNTNKAIKTVGYIDNKQIKRCFEVIDAKRI